MVLVLVCQQDGVEMPHARTQHLVTEIGPGIDDDAHAVRFDHRRSAQAVVAPVRRSADLAATPDDGHALRSTGSQKGEFHYSKDSKKSDGFKIGLHAVQQMVPTKNVVMTPTIAKNSSTQTRFSIIAKAIETEPEFWLPIAAILLGSPKSNTFRILHQRR